MVKETICLQCGDRGYENAFVYCIRCLNFAVHRYCLDVVPETFEEFVRWLCDDCNLKAQKQSAVIKHDTIPFQTKRHDVSKYIDSFSGNGYKESRLVVADTIEHVHEDGSEQTCDASAKSGESASQHTSVQLDGKNDGNAIPLITDVSKRFQLEEEKGEGNLTEPIQLPAGWLMQKKRKIKIRIKIRQKNGESTTEKDQDRLATASYDECVKLDAKECTRLASDLTLPSKVKENEFLGQKDQTCLSKPFDQIDNPAIVGVPADHPVISSNGSSRCLKKDGLIKDGNAILLPEDVSKRSQLEEERVERNLIEPVVLSVGGLVQKKRKIRIKIKKREINNRESTTEKDQDRLATTFSDEGLMKVDIKDLRPRLASDSALPSKVKENEFIAQKDQTCISKPSFSTTDPVIVDEAADHPVISSNGPSTFIEKDGDDVSKRSQFEEEKVEGSLIEPVVLSGCCLKQKNKERERNIMDSTTEKDQHRLATASHDEHVKVDVNKCTRSASDSTLPSKVNENECSEQKDQTCVSKPSYSITDPVIVDEAADHPVISSNGPSTFIEKDGDDVRKRSQFEEEKVEGNLIEPVVLSACCLKQKNKERERNIMDSTTEKDQHRLATASHDEHVKVDVNKCTRSASDSTLPSKVNENECSEQKDQTCVSKPSYSFTDPVIVDEAADHPVISTNGPSTFIEKDGDDVSKRSQFEEEKVEGSLIEPVVLSGCCLKQKNKERERNIMDSTTEKDQHRLATASHDEHVKVDVNKCTRSASDSTLPSKVNENECSEQKDQTCVSKPSYSITDPVIVDEAADHPVISSNGPSTFIEKDGDDVRKRSQFEEEKVEGNLIEPVVLSACCLKQKNKERERNIMDSTTEKDQHRLATASHDEHVKVDVNKCTRSASDSTLPSKVNENECSEQKDQTCVSKPSYSFTDPVIVDEAADHPVISTNGPSTFIEKDGDDVSKRSQFEEEKVEGNLIEPVELSACCLKQKNKERERNIMDSTTEKDQHRLATESHDEHVIVDVNKCTRSASDSTLPSKVKENECSEQKDQTCVSKSFDSISDRGIAGVPANHPGISSNEPSVSLRNEGNDILLPADVSSRSQLEEDKIKGNLIDPIDLSASCLNQKEKKIKRKKKKKRNLMESTSVNDQHRLGTTSYDKCVEVDVNECTRPACDSTSPSKVKENECSEQRDQTCISKSFDSITGLCITGVPIISSNGPSASFENDGNDILLPEDASTRSQLEEEKIEGNLIDSIDLSAGCLNQKEKKLKRKKQRRRNIMESTSKKDQHRLTPESYDGCVKVDVNECTGSANDSALPSKVKENECSEILRNLIEQIDLSAGCLNEKEKKIKRKKKRKRTIMESTTEKDQHTLVTTSYDTCVKVDIKDCTSLACDSTLPSKVKENDLAVQKKQTRVSKPYDSFTDLGITGFLANHSVISSNGTSMSLKNDRNGILPPADVSSRSQLEEEKIEGNPIEPIDLSAGCLNEKEKKIKRKKKRKRTIMESTTEKDQHSLATTSYDTCVKVDIKVCTRLACDSTLPSKVKENDFAVQKKQTRVSKPYDSITDLGITGLLAKHSVISSNGTSMSLKNDRNGILPPADVSSRSQLEEVKIEGNPIEPIDLSAGCLNEKEKKIKRKKRRKRTIMESTTEKDQHTLATTSYDTCVKVDIKDCTRLACDSTLPSKAKENDFAMQKKQTHVSKSYDSITDLGITDVSSRSQLEEEKMEGNPIEPIDLSAGCLNEKEKKIKRKKKRKRIVVESTTEKDQDTLASTSYDTYVKADINDCTRLACVPSKVKENKFSALKDHTCVSKGFDSIADLGIAGVPADHSVISSNGASMSLKNDGNGILLPADVSTQSQLQEEKSEGNLIEPINLSASCLNQKEKKTKRKKHRKRNIMESTTEKDQHRLATASYDERVKVDVNECTRSASDSTLPSKVKENECFEPKVQSCVSKSFDSVTNLVVPADHPVISSNGPSMCLQNDSNDILLPADDSSRSQLEGEKIVENLIESFDLSAGCLGQKKMKIKRKKKRQKNIKESTTEKDQHRFATTSCDERLNVDFTKCIRSADHPVISSDGPSRTLKKKKTIMSSATIPLEQLHQTGVAQPLRKNKVLFSERDCADLSTVERDLRSINDPIENREGAEERVEHTSTICQSKDACKYYQKDLGFSVAQPIAMPIWRGSFSIANEKYNNIDLLNAHISNKACHRVYEAASQFQPILHLEMHPKLDIWPKSFQTAEPNHENIALYFFPSKISEQVFEQLVGEMIHKELAFRAFVQNAELLIFTSTELPLLYWTFRGKYYLWGVFRGNQAPPSNNLSSKEVAEIPLMRKRCG